MEDLILSFAIGWGMGWLFLLAIQDVPGWLRALRSRWSSRSESRCDLCGDQLLGTRECPTCGNPQPTSPQPSAPSSQAEAGKDGG